MFPLLIYGVVAIKSAIKAGAVIGAKAAAKAASVAAAKAAAKAATVTAAKAAATGASKTATIAAATKTAAATGASKTATIAAATKTAAATGATKTAAGAGISTGTKIAAGSLLVSTIGTSLTGANKIRDDNKPPKEVKVEVKIVSPCNPNDSDLKGNDAKEPDSTEVASADVAEKDVSETDQVDQSSADVANKDVNEPDQADSDSAAKDVGQDDPSIDAIAGLEQAEALDSRAEGQIGDVSSTGLDDVNKQSFAMNAQASERDVLTGQTGQNASSSADAFEGLFTTKDPLTGMGSHHSSDAVTALQDSDPYKEASAWGSGQGDLRGFGTSLEERSFEADFMLQKQQINPMKLDVVSLVPSDQIMADPTQASDPMQPHRQDQFQQQREPVLA